jgi:hypothetical protein
MSEQPYTYVTLALPANETPNVGVSFHTSALWVRSGVLKNDRPYLGFSTPEANVSISSTGLGPVTEDDLATAREIYNAATHYLAECERLHVASTTAA